MKKIKKAQKIKLNKNIIKKTNKTQKNKVKSYKENQELSKFIINVIKKRIRPFYRKIYCVEETDKKSKPFKHIFAETKKILKKYKKYNNNHQVIDTILKETLNDFIENFIKYYEIKGKDELKIRELIKKAIKENPDGIIPFLAILNSTGRRGMRTMALKLGKMDLKNERIEFISAVDWLFNTTYLTEYICWHFEENWHPKENLKKI